MKESLILFLIFLKLANHILIYFSNFNIFIPLLSLYHYYSADIGWSPSHKPIHCDFDPQGCPAHVMPCQIKLYLVNVFSFLFSLQKSF